MLEIHAFHQLLLGDVEFLQLREGTEHLVRVVGAGHAREQHHVQRAKVPGGGLASGKVNALIAPHQFGRLGFPGFVGKALRCVHADKLARLLSERPDRQHIALAVARLLTAPAGKLQRVFSGCCVHRVDIAAAQIERAIVARLHDDHLARSRVRAHRFCLQAIGDAVDRQSWLLHFVAVTQKQGRVLVHVELGAVLAHRKGGSGLDAGIAFALDGREGDLAGVEIDAVDILELVGENVCRALVRRHLQRTGAEATRQRAGAQHLAVLEVNQAHLVGAIGDGHVVAGRSGATGEQERQHGQRGHAEAGITVQVLAH